MRPYLQEKNNLKDFFQKPWRSEVAQCLSSAKGKELSSRTDVVQKLYFISEGEIKTLQVKENKDNFLLTDVVPEDRLKKFFQTENDKRWNFGKPEKKKRTR